MAQAVVQQVTAELRAGDTWAPGMTAERTYHHFSYLDLPVMRALIALPQYKEYRTKALAAALLSWHYPLQEGFAVAPEQERVGNVPDFIVYTVKHQHDGNLDLYDCVFAEAKRSITDINSAKDQVQNALDWTENDSKRCYACTFTATSIRFYDFTGRDPASDEQAIMRPLADFTYDIWHHAAEISAMFNYMRSNPLPLF
ncbi:MAG: hypothetical protein M1836_007510 [Candelina mexicana]|nr:MAG: hypothetical protein M1836_007510 [Candelina mexicana]